MVHRFGQHNSGNEKSRRWNQTWFSAARAHFSQVHHWFLLENVHALFLFRLQIYNRQRSVRTDRRWNQRQSKNRIIFHSLIDEKLRSFFASFSSRVLTMRQHISNRLVSTFWMFIIVSLVKISISVKWIEVSTLKKIKKRHNDKKDENETSDFFSLSRHVKSKNSFLLFDQCCSLIEFVVFILVIGVFISIRQ